jgi:hypothetical protein
MSPMVKLTAHNLAHPHCFALANLQGVQRRARLRRSTCICDYLIVCVDKEGECPLFLGGCGPIIERGDVGQLLHYLCHRSIELSLA